MTTPESSVPRVVHRAPVVIVILALLVLAVVANATIKRNRVVARSAPSAALTAVTPHGSATSVAWYCAGPLPLGIKGEKSSLVLANVTDSPITGGISVADANGVVLSKPITIAGDTARTIVLPTSVHSEGAAATVLTNGAGLAVSEEILGKGGADISPCVDHATQTQYLAGGATTRPNTVKLSLYDPGATPSVASVRFATANGTVAPPAFQGLPISAGSTMTLDVGRYLPSQAILGTTVTSTGGPVVVGAVESAVATGGTVLPSLLSAAAVAEKVWWLAPAPAGTTARQKFTILNPSASAAAVVLRTSGPEGTATEGVTVQPGGVASLAPAADATTGAVRWATVTSDAPVVVSRTTTLLGPAKPSTKGAEVLTGAARVIAGLPAGYTVSVATPSLAKSWLIGDGESDSGEGELILVANPSSTPAHITFSSLTPGVGPDAITVAAGKSRVVSVPTNGSGTVLIVTSTALIVVDSGNYARGAKRSVGWSSPGAIVVN